MQGFFRFILGMSLGCGLLWTSSLQAETQALESKQPFENKLSLENALSIAIEDSPRLQEISARYEAAKQRPDQAGALPDPTLTLGLISLPTDSFDLDQEAMTQLQVGIKQPLPWLSKRRLAESSARFDAQATGEELAEARNRLLRDVAQAWWALYFLDHSLAVVAENQQRLREFNQITQSRYRVGKGLQQDVLQAQLELSNLLERELVLTSQRRVVVATLNTLLAQPAEKMIELSGNETPELPELPPLQSLINQALQQRPLLRQRQLQVKAARDRQELARKGLLPDLTLGAAYGYRQDAPSGADRADLFSVTLGIKLPLYANSKQHREIAQRGAELMAKKDALYSTQLDIRSEVVQSIATYERTQQQLELLEQGIIPQSKQTVLSMLSGYQVGKVDFTALVRSQLMLNNVQLQYWKAVVDGQRALVKLKAALGGEFDE
jgi:outer membrane protein TolC